MQDTTWLISALSALAATVAALWTRLTAVQNRLELLVAKEAECRARMDLMQADIDRKHAENVRLLATVCKGAKEP